MTEGSIEGAPGGHAEREDTAAAPNAGAFAAAIAMNEAVKSSVVAERAAAFLDAQKSLVDLQVKHFDRERQLAIDSAKLRRALDWLKLVMQSAVALAVIGIVIGLVAMVWNAGHDHSLVIESFTVPPDMAEHQIRGEDLAALIADNVVTIDAHAQSARAAETFKSDWGDDIKIEVPAAAGAGRPA